MAALEIQLLGTMSIARDGQPLTRLPGKRIQHLFSYLVLNRDALHPREQLAGLFWGDHEDAKARHCLNTALWRLNQALGPPPAGRHPWLHADAQNLGFNTAGDFELDVAGFDAACSLAEQASGFAPDQEAALYERAVRLYRADLLTDCYEDWCLVERERLRRLYLRALSRLLDWHRTGGRHAEAVECGHRILAHDSLREEVHRDIIEVHLSAGQPSEALRQYRVCEEILRRELGIAPMPETQALLPRIMRASPSGPAPALPAVARPVDDLRAAIAELRAAAASFDHARAQLQQALERAELLAGGQYAVDRVIQPVIARVGGDSCDPGV